MKATKRCTRRAAAAVELASLLPLLTLLFTAAVDFARAYHAAQVLQAAANTGAMYASGNAWAATTGSPPTVAAQSAAGGAGVTLPLPLSDDQLAQARAEAGRTAAVSCGTSLGPALTADQVTVTTAGTMATVTVTYDFPLLCRFLFPDGVQLRRTATARMAPNPFQ
jgi:Flp pilus assembly protein TadG